MPKFQLKLGEKWEDFVGREDDLILKAFIAGQKTARFHSRGQDYVIDFAKMVQRNEKTGRERQIRAVYDSEKKPQEKPIMPKPDLAQAVYGYPGGDVPVVQGAVVPPSGHGHGPAHGFSPGVAPVKPGPAYSGHTGAPVYAAAAVDPVGFGAPPSGPGHYGPPHGGAGYYGLPHGYGGGGGHYGPSPGACGAGGAGGAGGAMAGGTGAMLAAGGAGLLGGLILGEILD
eukprot:TRINITY_DN1529_c0_g1_i1.p1 TRINITY_DN1529_c0_g1~~TRINITY_DN1529_c0_g1_i1.p1  ORF type:complete len:228 (-),score=57.73 TRINITY_DN1529_c0_g1_i1:521-1204(-)